MRITAADFNGTSFDGSPFEPVFEEQSDLTWIDEAIAKKQLYVAARGHTDYAWFGVKDEYGNVTWAGPGNYLVYLKPCILVVPSLFIQALTLPRTNTSLHRPIEQRDFLNIWNSG